MVPELRVKDKVEASDAVVAVAKVPNIMEIVEIPSSTVTVDAIVNDQGGTSAAIKPRISKLKLRKRAPTKVNINKNNSSININMNRNNSIININDHKTKGIPASR